MSEEDAEDDGQDREQDLKPEDVVDDLILTQDEISGHVRIIADDFIHEIHEHDGVEDARAKNESDQDH